MTHIIGIDYGIKRIGVAAADAETRIALPLTTLKGRNDVTRDARQVTDLEAPGEIERYVVGLPLSMDGNDSPQTELTRRFASELERLSGIPVQLQDERLSTYAAQQALDEAGLAGHQRKGLIDQIAALKILQAHLDGPDAA